MVKSEEGQGTELRIFLPLSDEVEIVSEPVITDDQKSAKRPAASDRPGILVCDDYEHTRRIVQLTMKGYSVDLAASEKELFEQLDGQDFILLDINLNGRNVGEALLGRLREDPRAKNSRIIAFTAHALPGQGDAYKQQGFDGYLSKPFTRESLVNVVEGMC